MPPVGFETTISAGELQQTYALDRVATGTGWQLCYLNKQFLQQTKRLTPEGRVLSQYCSDGLQVKKVAIV